MKSGPLDQSRFKSAHQIGQTSRLKRRRDLGRRISAQQISATQEARRYIDRYIENIVDISPIFSIYRRYISQKMPQNFAPARVSHVSKFRPKYRPDSDISSIYRRYLPIFGDFSSKRLNVSKIASLASDTRNIADISANISDILVLDIYRYSCSCCVFILFSFIFSLNQTLNKPHHTLSSHLSLSLHCMPFLLIFFFFFNLH